MEKEVQNFISKFRSARAVLVYFYLNKKKDEKINVNLLRK